MIIENLYDIPPYSLTSSEKKQYIEPILKDLTIFHYNNCPEYKKLLDGLKFNLNQQITVENLPYIPIRLFKLFELLSSPREEIVKVMTSSGTSGQSVSKIFLSSQNTKKQSKVLTQIITSFIGKKRLPLLILDTEFFKKDPKIFSARGAGIIGFSTFGRKIQYALNNNMELDTENVIKFINENNNDPILLFGYTYIIWQFFIQALKEKNILLNINNGILFHIGGWKKLQNQSITFETFNTTVKNQLGNVNIHNYYGMAEQLGSVFVECEHGHMHCSNFSDIIIRNPYDFSILPNKQKGIIQLISLIPESYPGHSILTEDEGIILGEDDCKCGRKGKYFKILGRIKNAELRGCSDTYERN